MACRLKQNMLLLKKSNIHLTFSEMYFGPVLLCNSFKIKKTFWFLVFLISKFYLFQACTGIDNIAEAITLLELNNWDLVVRCLLFSFKSQTILISVCVCVCVMSPAYCLFVDCGDATETKPLCSVQMLFNGTIVHRTFWHSSVDIVAAFPYTSTFTLGGKLSHQ